MPQRLPDPDEDKKKTSKLGVFFLDPSLRRDRMSRDLWIRPERGKRKLPPPRPAPTAEWAAAMRLLRADFHHEAGASPGPPPRKGFSPAASLHAFPEAVLVHALPIPWMVCGLHNVLVPSGSSAHGHNRTGRAAIEHDNISEGASAGQGRRHC